MNNDNLSYCKRKNNKNNNYILFFQEPEIDNTLPTTVLYDFEDITGFKVFFL